MIITGLNLFFVLLCISSVTVSAQNFGFGCLGFTGGYVGYSYQKYSANGLNEYVRLFNLNNKDSLQSNIGNFGEANGFRVGLNIFRKKFSGVLLTAKGYYQSLSEKNEATKNALGGLETTSYEVKFINWGLGLDVGTPIVSFVNWKILDASLTYNQAKFTSTKNFPGAVTIVKNYKSDFQFGYSIGTGIILEILGEYITLEGLAAYSNLKIDKVKMDDGTNLTVSENSSEEMKNFITDGGFNAVIQLNIGIPL